jgi:hypothetical protein
MDMVPLQTKIKLLSDSESTSKSSESVTVHDGTENPDLDPSWLSISVQIERK